ncbi:MULTISPECIES: hemolysin family protein [unclassified Treponema]|uniref:hemolysin family protein n=1 Tax=unclassified Treponema TaxID=2638727 RepID=UPI0020A51E9E|nr:MULTISPECIES: hemolysin family protein [unclassified Treponema]UTC66698.1 HlyC/CorC family transporter [Treponema sp. OMZ 789]UTC69430.1 HlyC/CorC family transporter [Treponema sp. OMZ 790]UTC72144.1 HlyC/CorC family transporter [Treponema sp. OMZ 791]
MNEPPPQWLYILLLIILLFLSMIFSSGETAFLSVNKLKIKYLREKKNKKAARVEKILKDKQKFLTTSLIGNSLVNILISVILTALMVELVGAKGLSIAVTAATIAILIFGEILPKSVALVFSEPIALKFSGFILFLIKVLAPIEWLFSGFTKFFLKFLGVKNLQSNEALTDADLKDFFDVRQEHGDLRSEEKAVLEKILSYGDITVKNIMTPRPDIIGLTADASPKEIIELSHSSRFSRFPVYEEDIDEIIGIFYIKDFLFSEAAAKDFLQESKEKFDIKKYLRKPVLVFENTELSKLQEIFRKEKQNMVVVIDEYGGTLGIATLEDLNEEIFGNIADEYDTDDAAAEEPHLENINDETAQNINNTILGSMRLSDLNEELGTNFSSDYYDTIGGLIMEKCGEVPQIGSTIKIENYNFTVIKIEGNRISELEVNIAGDEE